MAHCSESHSAAPAVHMPPYPRRNTPRPYGLRCPRSEQPHHLLPAHCRRCSDGSAPAASRMCRPARTLRSSTVMPFRWGRFALIQSGTSSARYVSALPHFVVSAHRLLRVAAVFWSGLTTIGARPWCSAADLPNTSIALLAVKKRVGSRLAGEHHHDRQFRRVLGKGRRWRPTRAPRAP